MQRERENERGRGREGVREHAPGGLVARDEERDEVVAQLLLRHVRPAHVHLFSTKLPLSVSGLVL